jgi:hypothetical protein
VSSDRSRNYFCQRNKGKNTIEVNSKGIDLDTLFCTVNLLVEEWLTRCVKARLLDVKQRNQTRQSLVFHKVSDRYRQVTRYCRFHGIDALAIQTRKV